MALLRLPVTLLTGFLGSGKTTLLSKVLAQPAMSRAAVIVNEFGEVSIDHLIVAEVAENVLELRNGCLCCTIRGDLSLTLRELYRQRVLEEIPAFDQVVVETTGLAGPIPLAHTLMADPRLLRPFHLDGIVTVVDAGNVVTTVAAHPTAANQIALADIVVMTKRDLVSEATWVAAAAAVQQINPHAERIAVVQGEIDATRVFARGLFEPGRSSERIRHWLGTDEGDATSQAHDHALQHDAHEHDHGEAYQTHVIRGEGTLSLAGTSVFLNRLVNEQRDNILRIKGIAAFREKAGAVGIIHAVQDKFYPVQWLDAWPDDDHHYRLVFIGRLLDTEWLEQGFRALCVD